MSKFCLTLPVLDLFKSIEFYVEGLGAVVEDSTEDEAALDFFGTRLTLKKAEAPAEIKHFQFGAALTLFEFETLAKLASEIIPEQIVLHPYVANEGGADECRKLYLRCPDGYLIEMTGRE